MATHNPSGAIDLVPITFAVVDDAIVSAVDHKPKRTSQLQRLENIRQNSDVTVLVDHYDDDWRALWWVRVRGHASVHEVVPADALAALSDKYEQYRQHPPAGPAIVVRVRDVIAWNAGG